MNLKKRKNNLCDLSKQKANSWLIWERALLADAMDHACCKSEQLFLADCSFFVRLVFLFFPRISYWIKFWLRRQLASRNCFLFQYTPSTLDLGVRWGCFEKPCLGNGKNFRKSKYDCNNFKWLKLSKKEIELTKKT